jgi:hypothetical protein
MDIHDSENMLWKKCPRCTRTLEQGCTDDCIEKTKKEYDEWAELYVDRLLGGIYLCRFTRRGE